MIYYVAYYPNKDRWDVHPVYQQVNNPEFNVIKREYLGSGILIDYAYIIEDTPGKALDKFNEIKHKAGE